MKKRKSLWICIPVILLLSFGSIIENGRSIDLSVFWPENETLTVEGQIYKAGHTATASTIYLKNISVLSKPDNPLSEQAKQLLGKSNILVYLKDEPDFQIGDYVRVSGKSIFPKKPRNPGGFDGEAYYHAQNIYLMLRKASVLRSMSNKAFPGNLVYGIQKQISSVIDKSADETTGAVLKSILLGDRTDLDEEVKQLYQQNGIIHVLAISGLHISMIGMSLYQFFRKRGLSYLESSIVSFGVVAFYGLITGFPTSAIRATLMFLIYLGSQILGRTYDMITSLTLTATIMLITNPALITQSGFQLSFGAVLGVLAVRFFQSRLLCGTSLGVSLSVWLMTLPLTANSFYQIPIGGIFLNLLVVPSMTLVIILGIIGTFASFLSFSLGRFVFGPVHYVLKITLWICDLVRRIPGTVWITGQPAVVRILFYYLVLYGGFYIIERRKTKSLMYSRHLSFIDILPLQYVSYLTKSILVMVAVLILFLPVRHNFAITFLDVGQGDGTCIRTEEGHIYMVDGGSSSETKLATYTLEPYLKCMGYGTVDGWFVSHYDSDHVSGLIDMLESYDKDFIGHNTSGITIRRVILPLLDVHEDLQQEILKLAQQNAIPITYASYGDLVKDGKTNFQFYSPQKNVTYEDSNAGSMVMKVSYEDLSVLMTGDVQGKGEKDLLNCDLGDIDVLKVAHHGSKNSSGMDVLEHIAPKVAVISVGKNNCYGHPAEEVIENLKNVGCKIVRTDEEGAIEIKR